MFTYDRSLRLVCLSGAILVISMTGCGGDVGRDSSNGGASTGGANSTNPPITLGDPLVTIGENNAVATGGYWWTYTDHNVAGSPYHATISQVTSLMVALQPTVDSDASHGKVIRVSGSVPPALPWTQVITLDPSTIDKYWQAIYPDSEIPTYPAAGVGFGFRKNNAVYDATGGGAYIGIAFDLKVNTDTPLVYVSMRMVGTDLPDPNYSDSFPKQCQYYTVTNTIAMGGASCFAYHRTGLYSAAYVGGPTNSYNTLTTAGLWKRYCVLYSEMKAPDWASAATLAMLPAFDPKQLVKVTWDMYQPPSSEPAAGFDVSIDNVTLITPAQASLASNNCDPSKI